MLVGNDDGKKMMERDAVVQFAQEYTRVTGEHLELRGMGERPDFVCAKDGELYGLELVRAMRNPVDASWDVIMGSDGQLSGLDAAILIQELVYRKEAKRASPGWQYPDSAILVVQLIGSDGDSAVAFLDDTLMSEMAETGFREIWIADYSPMEPFGEIQLIGVKPDRWRGLHRHRLYGTKPYG